MNIINEKIAERKQQLQQILALTKTSLRSMPEGSLRITHKRGKPHFYATITGSKPKYVSKSNYDYARNLAQKAYLMKVITEVSQQLNVLNRLDDFDDEAICAIYDSYIQERKDMVIPFEISDDDYAIQWQSAEYNSKGVSDYSPEYITARGEHVRSKSEVIIADRLSFHQIPYKYEVPVHIKGYGDVYPDFTVLNKYTRKEYIYEHFGMMDDPRYCEKTIRKIEDYERNGYIPGYNFAMTFGTKENPLSSRVVDILINKYFK